MYTEYLSQGTYFNCIEKINFILDKQSRHHVNNEVMANTLKNKIYLQPMSPDMHYNKKGTISFLRPSCKTS